MPAIIFPVCILKPKDSFIYFFTSKTLGLISIGGEKFYTSGLLYDSAGNCFNIQGVKSIYSASFWDSLRYLQSMKRVELKIEFNRQISLEEGKTIIKNHILKYPRKWEARASADILIAEIQEKADFTALIEFTR